MCTAKPKQNPPLIRDCSKLKEMCTFGHHVTEQTQIHVIMQTDPALTDHYKIWTTKKMGHATQCPLIKTLTENEVVLNKRKMQTER